jgi:hypothetical protein
MLCNRTKLAIKHRIKKNKTNKQAIKQKEKKDSNYTGKNVFLEMKTKLQP